MSKLQRLFVTGKQQTALFYDEVISVQRKKWSTKINIDLAANFSSEFIAFSACQKYSLLDEKIKSLVEPQQTLHPFEV